MNDHGELIVDDDRWMEDTLRKVLAASFRVVANGDPAPPGPEALRKRTQAALGRYKRANPSAGSE